MLTKGGKKNMVYIYIMKFNSIYLNFENYFSDMRVYLEALAVELAENSLVHGGTETNLQILQWLLFELVQNL